MSTQLTYKLVIFSNLNKLENTSAFHSSFSGKEKDSETGYHYFGARYYNSDLSVWLSVDPMAEKYPSLSPYNYCAWNPMKLVDPDGRDGRVVVKKKNDGGTNITIGTTVYLKSNVFNRNKLASLAKSVEFEAQRVLKSKEINGVTVSFDVKYRAYPGQQLLPGDNVLTVNPYSSETSHVKQQIISDENSTYKTAGTNGYINSDIMDSKGRSRDRGIIHETMHFLGLSDRYSGTNSSFEGFENDIMGGNARDADGLDMTHYNSYINTYGDIDMGNSPYLLLNTTIDIKETNLLKSLNNAP